jgi:parallel beta helix pectate lyase-like protein
MRTHSMWTLGKSTAGRVMWLLAAVVLLLPSAVQATTVSVDCNAGGSINAALSGLDLEGPNLIIVTGTCHENVAIIDRERLTIFGSPTATIVAADPTDTVIFVLRSRSIRLARLVLSGGSFGLIVLRSEVQVNGSTMQNNSAEGVAVSQMSSLQFGGNIVQNNGGSGITVNQTSRAVITGGTVQGNAGDGIVVANGSSAPNIGGEIIQNNGGFGVIAFHTSAFQLIGSTIVGNGSTGVRVSETSHGEIAGDIIRNNGAADPSSPGGGVVLSEGGEAFIDGDNDISNNTGPGVLVMTHGTLSSEGGNTINNNTAEGINLRRQSVGQFFAADTISGNGAANLACDTTSLAAGDLTGVTNIRCMNIERALGPPRPGHIMVDPPSPPEP